MPAKISLRRRALALLIVAGLTSQSAALANDSLADLLAEGLPKQDSQVQQVVLQEAYDNAADGAAHETALADPHVAPMPQADAAQAVVVEQPIEFGAEPMSPAYDFFPSQPDG
ncbi:MAG: hypothetical protein WBD20_05290 [Pirellulaceae bacterium]